MLAAQKGALERQLHVQMLDLQWKELDYLHTNFQNLATAGPRMHDRRFRHIWGRDRTAFAQVAAGGTWGHHASLAFG